MRMASKPRHAFSANASRNDEVERKSASQKLREHFWIPLVATSLFLILLIALKGCSNSVYISFGNHSGIAHIVHSFDEGEAFKLLKEQVAMGARVPNTDAHKKCMMWLEKQMKGYTDQVHVQRFKVSWRGETYELANIIALFAGSSGDTLLIGTHWDCHPTADRDEDLTKRTEPVPGANDGASGVAILLELAKVLKAHTPPITVMLALFDGEDFGDYAYGSKHFVSNPTPYMPDAVIIIDMVGDADLRISNELNSIERSRKLWETLMESVRALSYERYFSGSSVRIFDDHIPFINAGKQAILLIDFDYPYWHTTNDTVDKCSQASLGIVGRSLIRFIFVDAKKLFKSN
jgi:hypothetical protein